MKTESTYSFSFEKLELKGFKAANDFEFCISFLAIQACLSLLAHDHRAISNFYISILFLYCFFKNWLLDLAIINIPSYKI